VLGYPVAHSQVAKVQQHIAGVGTWRPCMRSFTSFTLVAFLNQLIKVLSLMLKRTRLVFSRSLSEWRSLPLT